MSSPFHSSTGLYFFFLQADPEGQGAVIPGEALSSGPWPQYLTPDWLIHIPGVELGYMRCVRHGAQHFLSNTPTSVRACLSQEVLVSRGGVGRGWEAQREAILKFMFIISCVCDPHVSTSPNWIPLLTPARRRKITNMTCVFETLREL